MPQSNPIISFLGKIDSVGLAEDAKTLFDDSDAISNPFWQRLAKKKNALFSFKIFLFAILLKTYLDDLTLL